MKVVGHIYCLRNPIDSNNIFYVGQTVMSLNNRLISHVGESKVRITAKGIIITKILEAGMRPVIESLELFEGESYSDIDALMNEREIYWIKQFSGLCNKNYAGLDLICDNCTNPFKAKRLRARFCSDICRATFHQKNAKKKEEKINKETTKTPSMMEVLNKFEELLEKIESRIIFNPTAPQSLDDKNKKTEINSPSQIKENTQNKSEFYFIIKKKIDLMEENWEADIIWKDLKETPMPFFEKKQLEFILQEKYKNL